MRLTKLPYIVRKVSVVLACIGGVVLLGVSWHYFYLFKSSKLQFEKRLPTLTLTPTSNISEKQLLSPTFAPTPTLAPGQKAIYAFYILSTPQTNIPPTISLQLTDAGKIIHVDKGTVIYLHVEKGKYRILISSPQAIFKGLDSNGVRLPKYQPEVVYGLRSNVIGRFEIVKSGLGTITMIETE